MRNVGFVLISLCAAACGVGEDGDNNPADDLPYEDEDPNPNRLQCSEAFRITGTWTPKEPLKPVDVSGCWGVGTWSFTVAVDSTAPVLDITGDGQGDRCQGAAAPQLAPGYSFEVNKVMDDDGWVETWAYTGPTTFHSLYQLKVSEGGGGECEGGLTLISADRKSMWNFKPALNNGTLTGQGDFTVFLDPQVD